MATTTMLRAALLLALAMPLTATASPGFVEDAQAIGRGQFALEAQAFGGAYPVQTESATVMAGTTGRLQLGLGYEDRPSPSVRPRATVCPLGATSCGLLGRDRWFFLSARLRLADFRGAGALALDAAAGGGWSDWSVGRTPLGTVLVGMRYSAQWFGPDWLRLVARVALGGDFRPGHPLPLESQWVAFDPTGEASLGFEARIPLGNRVALDPFAALQTALVPSTLVNGLLVGLAVSAG